MLTDAQSAPSSAAFFDVDGTLVNTTIVHYYRYFRSRRMSAFWRPVWNAGYLVKCGYYLVLDKIDRCRLNIVFYRSYAGLRADDIKAQAEDCYHELIEPRLFGPVARCIADHRAFGRTIVLVTGSIDFIVQPLAKRLEPCDLLAPSLVEADGCFTGELDGPPVGGLEKATRIEKFAEANGIDLAGSHAYGDSIADLPMLECVGHPHVVNPDRSLATTARSRGWPAHRWSIQSTSEGNGR